MFVVLGKVACGTGDVVLGGSGSGEANAADIYATVESSSGSLP